MSVEHMWCVNVSQVFFILRYSGDQTVVSKELTVSLLANKELKIAALGVSVLASVSMLRSFLCQQQNDMQHM